MVDLFLLRAIKRGSEIIQTGTIVRIHSGSPDDYYIGKVVGFHENLTDHQTCASIEYLYWHDEVEDWLKKLRKCHRLEMRSYEKNEVFYSTHRDTIEIQTIAEPTTVAVVGVNPGDCSAVPSNHLLARWRIDLSKREFLPIITEMKDTSTKRVLRDTANKTVARSSHRTSLRGQSDRENSTPVALKPTRIPRPCNKFSPRIVLTRTPKASIHTTPVAKARHTTSAKSSNVENWTGVEFVPTPPNGIPFSSYRELAAGMHFSPVTSKRNLDTNDQTPEIKSGGGPESNGSACKRCLNLDTSDILDKICEGDDDEDIVLDSEDDCMMIDGSDEEVITRDVPATAVDGGDEEVITRDVLATTVETRRERDRSENRSTKQKLTKKVEDRSQRSASVCVMFV